MCLSKWVRICREKGTPLSPPGTAVLPMVVFGWTVTAEIHIESLSDLGFLKDSAPGVCC